MSKHKLQDELQQTAKEAFLNSVHKRGILLMGTGTGKSRTTILIAKALKPKRILLLTDSTRGRDVEWPKQFEAWKAKGLWGRVEAHCYQSAYKFVGQHWDLCIADELDFALTDELSKVFFNNTFGSLLGLTATLDESKMALAQRIFGPSPVLFRYSTQTAQETGILNQTRFVVVNYRLSEDPRSYFVSTAKGGFWTSENQRYLWLEEKVAEVKQEIADCEPWQYKSLMAKKRMLTGKRMNFLHTLNSSRLVATRVKNKILSKADNKVLIFCKRTEQADLLGPGASYHAKNKKDNTAIDAFNKGIARELVVVDALNRGINLTGANRLVLKDYNGSSTEFQQKHGRGTRLEKEDMMYFYIFIPHYRTGALYYHTQAGQWAKEMVQGFKMGELEHVTIDYTNEELQTLLADESTRSKALSGGEGVHT